MKYSLCADEDDYVPLVDHPLIIPAQSTAGNIQCTMYQVLGDDIREAEETFTISFGTENENDEISAVTMVTVTIPNDGDCKFMYKV